MHDFEIRDDLVKQFAEQQAEIAALRAQLAAALSKLQIEVDTRCTPDNCQWVARVKELDVNLAAARSDAVRDFAEWCKHHTECVDHDNPGTCAARYLSSLGVPSARPDDGRVERQLKAMRDALASEGCGPWEKMDKPDRDSFDMIFRAALAAADGAERGGR